MRTWRLHNPEMKIVLINESNVRDYIPDMPEEFWRQPYHASKSDIIRAAALYHHGGLYAAPSVSLPLSWHSLGPSVASVLPC